MEKVTEIIAVIGVITFIAMYTYLLLYSIYDVIINIYNKLRK